MNGCQFQKYFQIVYRSVHFIGFIIAKVGPTLLVALKANGKRSQYTCKIKLILFSKEKCCFYRTHSVFHLFFKNQLFPSFQLKIQQE